MNRRSVIKAVIGSTSVSATGIASAKQQNGGEELRNKIKRVYDEYGEPTDVSITTVERGKKSSDIVSMTLPKLEGQFKLKIKQTGRGKFSVKILSKELVSGKPTYNFTVSKTQKEDLEERSQKVRNQMKRSMEAAWGDNQ